MNVWKMGLVLFVFYRTSVGNFKDVLVTKMKTCANSTQLSATQKFTPVAGLAECSHLYLASREIFMLVRTGIDGVTECGHTSILPHTFLCNSEAGDVAVYMDAQRGPKCDGTSLGMYRFSEDAFCLHNYSDVPGFNYSQAKGYCSSKGERLLELESREDLLVLASFKIGGYFWVGADDYKKQDSYTWTSGRKVNSDLFGLNEPDEQDEHCLACKADFGLADYQCDSPFQQIVCAALSM